MDQTFGLLRFVSPGSYARGVVYASQRRAKVTEHDAGAGTLRGRTLGSNQRSYDEVVHYAFDEAAGQFTKLTSSCSCPVRSDCKHVVALLLTALDLLPHALKPANAATAPGRVAAPAQPAQVRGPIQASGRVGADNPYEWRGPRRPEPTWEGRLATLFPQKPTERRDLALVLDFREPEPGREATLFSRGHLQATPMKRGKAKAWVKTGVSIANLRAGAATDIEPQQAAAVRSLIQLCETFVPYSGTAKDSLRLDTVNSALLTPVLREVLARGVTLIDPDFHPVFVESTDAVAEVAIEERDAGALALGAIFTHPQLGSEIALGVGAPPQLIAWRDQSLHLAFLAEPPSDQWLQLRSGGTLLIPEKGRARFETEVFSRLARQLWSSPDGSFEAPPIPAPRLHLTLDLSDPAAPVPLVNATWTWRYGEGDGELGPYGLSLPKGAARGVRDVEAEADIVRQVTPIVAEHMPSFMNGQAITPHVKVTGGEVLALNALTTALREADVEVEENLPTYTPVELNKVGIDVGDTTRDWLDLNVRVEVGGSVVPTALLIRALTLDEEYVFLENGSYLSLDRPELAKLRALLKEARSLTDQRGGGIRVPKVRQTWWEELLELGIVDAAQNAWFDAVRSASLAPVVPAEVPAEVNAQLRPYQVEGFRWLARLRDQGLGGVLADDMGLGKTLQILTMIARDRSRTPDAGPWLVVAPTSVVANWVSEAEKFTPHLKVVGIDSTAARASSQIAALAAGADVVVTSYTLLRLDEDVYSRLEPTGLVLDEAQNVKNHASKGFAVAAALGAPSTFVVTGTPIENNLSELWAMFALAAPGLLGSPRQFATAFRGPIEENVAGGDQAVSAEYMARLRRRIEPFLLRRTKRSVALDLPEKAEQVVRVELAPDHRRLYDRQLQHERQSVLKLTADGEEHRFQVLAALTRLRQMAIDPRLVDADSKATPSKLEALMELLGEAVSEGHRALVFSQFTSFLALVRERLEAEGIAYSYLDGATRARAKVIDEFAGGEAPVFLISLKAGGTGLNLTMADYAILTDPWWNPAAEEQAVDRTHRIGQTRPVHVYRLVSEGTVEEKVVALQDQKRALLAVLSDDPAASAGGKALSGEELRALLA
ncbi:superfamily II DNA or RNA helicase [Arcanobacterium wilhelmae]|uniref:Superfamily II DNA or RNA helicase n=1 Tax=Arcanobacterium wilhelmae TaxID=1803177 RepID=A0ABT9NC97_9ACTO|nr:DEAD/DEAH box helicase [Arcanobacterium wilhelmae]MDP9801302.1 superfamily II DNA or RNA helicase [Arcanobacterium wilhelmae]WFN90646.1 SNF2-related protein [Arcanobacterium wilhelmae]